MNSEYIKQLRDLADKYPGVPLKELRDYLNLLETKNATQVWASKYFQAKKDLEEQKAEFLAFESHKRELGNYLEIEFSSLEDDFMEEMFCQLRELTDLEKKRLSSPGGSVRGTTEISTYIHEAEFKAKFDLDDFNSYCPLNYSIKDVDALEELPLIAIGSVHETTLKRHHVKIAHDAGAPSAEVYWSVLYKINWGFVNIEGTSPENADSLFESFI